MDRWASPTPVEDLVKYGAAQFVLGSEVDVGHSAGPVAANPPVSVAEPLLPHVPAAHPVEILRLNSPECRVFHHARRPSPARTSRRGSHKPSHIPRPLHPSRRPDVLIEGLASSSSRRPSTWTTRATKPRHLQLADLRRIRSIRPTAPRNPAFGRVEGENGLAESPKRASEMSEGARGPCPTQNAPPSMRGHCGQGPPRELDAQGGQCRADRLRPHGSASCR